MRKLLPILFIAFTSYLSAQKGDFLLTHHSPSQGNLDHSNFDIINDKNGLICLANRTGVLKYDGDSWDFYPTTSAALSLAVDDDNIVYVGGIDNFGKIDFNENSVAFQSLINRDSISDLFLQTVHFGKKVYFLGSQNLAIYDTQTDKVQWMFGNFLNLFQIEEELFVNTVDETFTFQGDSLASRSLGIQISSVHHRKSRPSLLVDFAGEIFVWDKRAKRISQNKLIAENGYEINEAKWVNDSLIACSTFSSGVGFLNYNDADFIEVTDYHSGLPDNEIYTLHTDNSGEVWVAHPFGLTSISPLFPAFSYSNFPGLRGNLTGLFQLDQKLWVTTSLGLFHFDKDTTFKNQVYYTKVSEKKRNPQPKPKTPVAPVSTKEKKPILKGLFKKKKRVEESTQKEKKGFLKTITRGVEDLFHSSENAVDRISGKLDKSVKYERHVRKVPVKINYLFSKVEGTNGKFFNLIAYQDKLLAISNSGVYEITEQSAELVISENVRSVVPVSSGQLLISTSDLLLKSFRLLDDIWVEQASEGMDDIIVNMQEDSNGNIWLAGSSHLYKVGLTDTSLVFSNSYILNNQFLDEVDILERKDTVYFINSQGYFYYDSGKEEIVENTAWRSQIGTPVSSISEPTGKGIWINNGKTWFLIPSRGSIQQFEYIGLFQDLISISKDLITDEYWLLTRGNDLLKYNPSKSKELASYQFFVKKLTNQKGDIERREKFSLAYDENFLTVELSKPDFLGLLNPEFQYKLEGLHSDWSDWTRSKSIDFSYLPAGEYSLSVRSRDSFGRIEEANMLSFKVRSPYWQQPWFYALQILFFGALVVVSSRMNQSKSQNRLISGGLSVLTLVLIIEFIQSAAGAFLDIKSTPVVDFLIDVFVALLIFPLEKFLRNFLSNGKVEVPMKGLVKKNKKAANAER